MMNISEKKLAVVGLGYVGLPLLLLAEQKGYDVVGVDLNEEKVGKLQSGKTPFYEEGLDEKVANSKAEFTSDFSKIEDAGIIAICVPTPVHKDHMPNLEPVKGAARSVGEHLEKGQLVILESTVNPGVSEGIVMSILEESSGLKCGEDFHLAHAPERINPGDQKWNVENINRVVGSSDEAGLGKAADFYESIITGTVKRMGSLKEAEAVKVVENSFRDINIAFVNELARSFSRLGIDVVNVIDGAATKPFAFMPHYPGAGVGGHCIPVDPYYLIEYAKRNGFQHDFLALARRINSGMPEFVRDLVIAELNEKGKALKGSRIAVLGLAYKPNTGDSRESPSYEIIKLLKEKGAEVETYDPYIPEESTAENLEATIQNVDAMVIATAHKGFMEKTPEFYKKHDVNIIIDGRNCLPKNDFRNAGVVYRGVGR